jgi:hypothetical protein
LSKFEAEVIERRDPMEKMAEHHSLDNVREKTNKPMIINDFLLTYMLLSPKPVVAVSKAITGENPPAPESPKAAECYVLEIPWQRDC